MSKTPIPRNLQAEVFNRDKYICRYCGDKNGPFEIDHVYPESQGGQTILSNLAVSCKACNRAKSDAIGMWPFPVGYFESQDAPAIRDESRYWSYLSVALNELHLVASLYHDINSRYLSYAYAYVKRTKKKDASDYIAFSTFCSLLDSSKRIQSKLTTAEESISKLFPSKTKLFLLTLTGQNHSTTDVESFIAALKVILQDIKIIHDKTKETFDPIIQRQVESKSFDTDVLNFVNPAMQNLDDLCTVTDSIGLIIDLLENAQSSLGIRT